MIDPIRELTIRAAILHRRLSAGDPLALPRLWMLPEFRREPVVRLATIAPRVKRRHCLTILARELGFAGWPHAKSVIAGAYDVSDFGTLLYPNRCGGFLNLWYSGYHDAVTGQRASDGYLLAYRRHFMVVQAPFIEQLGLDPTASEWRRLGYDWVRPLDVGARTRLYGALIARMPREGHA